MPPRLPPLHDLVAVEAPARLMRFLKASEELHGTQSAVSHRIKALEEFLGVPLYIRVRRNIALTLKTLFDGYAAGSQLVNPFALDVRDRAYTIVLSPEAEQKPAVPLFTA